MGMKRTSVKKGPKVDTSKLQKTTWVKQGLNQAINWTKKGQEAIGIYVRTKIVSTKNGKQNQYEFVDAKGEPFFIWETTVLKILSELNPGQPCKVKFLGEEGKKGRRYKNFIVEFGE